MDGPGNKNIRAEWYDIIHPLVSPVFSRTDANHRARRRIWTHALSTHGTASPRHTPQAPIKKPGCRHVTNSENAAISTYLPRILAQIDVLQETVARYGTGPVPVNDVMLWFAFDSMGEFAFNQSFGMMKTGTWHKVIKQQRSGLSIRALDHGIHEPSCMGHAFGLCRRILCPSSERLHINDSILREVHQ